MTTLFEQDSIPGEAWEQTVDVICQALRGYSQQHGVSLDTMLSLLMVDLCKLNGLPHLPASTRQRSAHPQQHWTVALRHLCKKHWTCPRFCDLCDRNPNKRCENNGDLAPKHLEGAKLETCCGASLQAALCCFEPLAGEHSTGATAFDDDEAQKFYTETSLVSAHKLETWLEQHGSEANMTVDALRQFEVLVTKDKPNEQLLKKGANSQDTSDNHRVRADFLEGKNYAGIDVRVIENSDKRLGANNKYRLLVVLIRKLDGRPVGHALSNRFQVTTTRALSGWNALIPCWDTPVHKLDGCGERTQINLQNVRKCAWEKGRYTPPAEGINQVNTVEDFLQLRQEMKSWVGVPRTVRAALTPDATAKHADKMLPKDSRMRIFWPKNSQYGAMYLCHQGHVDLTDSSSGVLMTYSPFRDAIAEHATVRITLPEGRNAEQNQEMTQLAKDAKVAWEQERHHHDWYAAKQDGEFLMNLFRKQETVNGGLDFLTHELAKFLGLQPSVFPLWASHPSADPQLALGAQAQEQAPLLPQPHNQPGVEPSTGAGLMLGDDSFLHEAGASPSNSAASLGMSEPGLDSLWDDSPPLSRGPPSSSFDSLGGQPPVGYEPCHSARDHIHSPFPSPLNTPPPNFCNLNQQGSPDHSSSTSPREVPCLPNSAPTPPGSPQLGPAPPGAQGPLGLGQGWPGRGCEQHISPPAGMLQPQQPSASSCMQQHVQASEGMRLGSGQGLLARPMSPAPDSRSAALTDQRLSQSHTERVRPRLEYSTSLERQVSKRRHTAPPGAMELTVSYNGSQDPFGHPVNACNELQSSHLAPGAVVTVSQADALGRTQLQVHTSWSAAASAPSYYTTVSGVSSSSDSVGGALPGNSLLAQLPEDDFWVSLFAAADGVGDEEQQVAGQDEVEEIQPHVTHAASDFLATIRALAVRTRLRQLGAAAQSPALESSPRRWQRALLAVFAHRRPLWVDDPVARGKGDDELICNIIMDNLDL